jgi:hypothetical protein
MFAVLRATNLTAYNPRMSKLPEVPPGPPTTIGERKARYLYQVLFVKVPKSLALDLAITKKSFNQLSAEDRTLATEIVNLLEDGFRAIERETSPAVPADVAPAVAPPRDERIAIDAGAAIAESEIIGDLEMPAASAKGGDDAEVPPPDASTIEPPAPPSP